jgi:hypothetical protein
VLVDLAQSRHTQPLAKLMQHPRLRQNIPVGQMGKATPGSLFGQHLDKQIVRVHGRQERQQMDPPKLGATKEPTSATSVRLRKLLVDPRIGNVGRESCEQSFGSGSRQQRIHGSQSYPKNSRASAAISPLHFLCISSSHFATSSEFPNTLK